MRRLRLLVLMTAIMGLLAGAAQSKDARKLPVSAYIKSAKIEILSGDPVRYKTAEALLDSLFMYYGYHAEGLWWMSQMAVDGIESAPDPTGKAPYVQAMVAYFDTLRQCCEDKKIKESYKAGCDDYIVKADSIGVKYWREFYNAGIDQLKMIDTLKAEKAKTQDSGSVAYIDQGIQANFDSCLANMNLAISIDSSDSRAHIAIGTAYQKMGQYEQSAQWKSKAIESARRNLAKIQALQDEGKLDDPNVLAAAQTSLSEQLLSVAYDYINSDKYEEAIPPLAEYVERNPDDVENMHNLSICYNNAGRYDDAMALHRRILEVAPDNVQTLSAMGRYFNEMGRRAADSAKQYTAGGKAAEAEAFSKTRDALFDSSHVYFKRAYGLDTTDLFVVEMYALTSALGQEFGDAAEAFGRLTEMQPDNFENWISLGDCLLNLKRFDESIHAYEKVVQLDPGNKQIWQQLVDLYHERGDADKEAAARKHVQ